MSVLFSPSTGNFYASEFQAAYVAAGTWPADAAHVDDSVWQTYARQAPSGMARGAVNGAPAWVAAPVVDTPPPPTTITSTAFLNRFTPAELGALMGNPQTVLLLITCAAANSIDLTDPAVKAGINGLTPAGTLAPGRATVILTP